MAAILDFRLPFTSDSIKTSSIELLNLEIVGVAVEISLLSWMRAEIYVIAYLLPINGRHLWYTTYSDIRQFSH